MIAIPFRLIQSLFLGQLGQESNTISCASVSLKMTLLESFCLVFTIGVKHKRLNMSRTNSMYPTCILPIMIRFLIYKSKLEVLVI